MARLLWEIASGESKQLPPVHEEMTGLNALCIPDLTQTQKSLSDLQLRVLAHFGSRRIPPGRPQLWLHSVSDHDGFLRHSQPLRRLYPADSSESHVHSTPASCRRTPLSPH